MARQIVTSVHCAGELLAPGLDFQQLSLTQSLFDHHTFSLMVPFDRVESSKTAFFSKAPGQLLGKSIEIQLSPDPEFSAKGATGLKFKGLVTGLGTSADTDYANSITVQGFSPCYLLADGLQKRTFVDQTLAAIFRKVLGPLSNTLAQHLAPRHTAKITYAVQYRETDFAFLSRLAGEYDEWFYYDGLTLQLGPPASNSSIAEFVADGVHNRFHIGLALQPMRVKLYDYSYQSNQHFTSLTSAQSLSTVGKHPFGQLVLEHSEKLFQRESHAMAEMAIENVAQLNAEATSLKAHRVADLVVLQGQSDNPALQLGRVLRVSGTGLGSHHVSTESFGSYRITELTHHVDSQGNYRNSFTAIPHMLDVPPVSPHYAPPAGAQELAEVIADNDPQQLGRLKVRYHWPVANPQDAETGWLRVLTPYSGNGKGQLFKPEIGSQVLVGYQAGLAEQPFVMGNLFHGSNKQSAKYSPKDNHLKGLQTAGGNKVVMMDHPGKQTILLSNSNNKATAVTVSFAGDGSVHIQSKGPVTVNGSVITLDAGEKGEIKMHAKNITLVAEDDVKVTAKTKGIGLKAQKDIVVEATEQLQLKGTKGAGLTSPKTVDLGTGTTVNISATTVNQS